MKKVIILLLFVIFLKTSEAQDTAKINRFYNKEFDWTITIPPNFDTVSAEAWAKVKNRGAAAVEKTYNQKIIDQTKTIFLLSSGRSNYFEVVSQPYDSKKDGSYRKLNKEVNDVIYHTLATQIPGAKLDSATITTVISNLTFNAFILKAVLPNGLVFSIYSFSRLFGKSEFAVNIIFLDSSKGDIMLDTWKRSTFGSSH